MHVLRWECCVCLCDAASITMITAIVRVATTKAGIGDADGFVWRQIAPCLTLSNKAP
jgi:hypothetical protein